MKSQRSKKQPSVSAAIAPAAAVTAALLPTAAFAGVGDLDPAFGSVGRLDQILEGPAWALEAEDNGSMILGGGRPAYSFYYWGCCYYNPPNSFIYRVTDDGEIDLGYKPPVFEQIQVRDVARQPDGQVVAVGRRYLAGAGSVPPLPFQLVAYRVLADGTRDTSFAGVGLFTLSPDDFGERQSATSVVLDPDGRIVIAGTRDDSVMVLRLLPDGSIDDSFGDAGFVVGPTNLDYSADGLGARTSILRDESGGYRLTASNNAGCQVLALASDGAVDAAFGAAGLATAEPTDGSSTQCNAIAQQPGGNLLVAGSSAGQGFLKRLLPDGQLDAAWTSDAVSNRMTAATAVAVSGNDSLVVAGRNGADSLLMRLAPDGMPDTDFGKAGSTVIDLRLDTPPWYTPVDVAVHDIHIDEDGAVAAVGGTGSYGDGFAVRLLGDAGGDSPGVIGFDNYSYAAPGEGSEVVLTLRRSGGSSGAVSVAYRSAEYSWGPALPGADYELIPGRISWTDGDRGDQEIRIPIFADATTEGPEAIVVDLYDVQGGAGLGSYSTIAVIPADGSPHGQLAFEATGVNVTGTEGSAATLTVSRNFYATGAVSVTLTPEPGSAQAGLDFDASPITVSWADGEAGVKVVQIPIVDDTVEELSESFIVRLSDPTGGAILGDPSWTTVRINANDRPLNGKNDKGGGAAGLLSIVFLGFVAIMRRLFRL